MDRISRSVVIAAVLLGGYFHVSAALSHEPEEAAAPEMILGTAGTQYQLFTPQEVVTAGGGGAPGAQDFTDLEDTPSTYTGAGGQVATVKSDETGLEFTSLPSPTPATPLSDATPADLGTATAGTASAASRGDHVHKRPAEIAENTAAVAVNAADIARKPGLADDDPKPVGNAANGGTATSASRSDHAHSFANYGTAVKAVAAASSAGVLDQASRVDHVHASAAQSNAPLRILGSGRWRNQNTSFSFTPPVENLTMFMTADRPALSGWAQMPAKNGQVSFVLAQGLSCSVARTASNRFAIAGTCAGANREGIIYFIDTAVVAGSGGGGATNLSDAVPLPISNTTASAGSLNAASRGDHQHTYGGGARFVPDPQAAGVMDGWVLTVAGQNIYGWAAPTGGGSGGSSTFLGLTDTPSAYTGEKGKIPAVNAAENALSFVNAPPDLTDDVNGNTGAIEALDFLTQDLIAGVPSTGWATVTDVSNAGIAVFSGAASCSPARAATYTPSVSNAGGKYPVVRVKTGFATANVRTLITGQGTATDLVSGWALLCLASDENFAFYHPTIDGQTEAFGAGVSTAAVQTTGGAHIGTSKYQGDPTKVERWAIVGNTTHIPAGKAYPAITGQAGKVLTVNSGATGVEWAAGGGGGGGSGGAVSYSFVSLGEIETIGTQRKTHTMTTAEAAACAKNRLFHVELTGNGQSETTLPFFLRDPTDGQVMGIYDFDTAGNGAFQVEVACTATAGTWKIESLFGAPRGTDATLYAVTLDGGGGGGGSSGPTIPDPTAAGALDYLRVNSAGAAYELADFPAIPEGSTDTPKPDSAMGFNGTSNKWSPSDHSHPITGHDSVTWTRAEVSTLTGGGASGGVDCDGSAGYPTTEACKNLTDAWRRGDFDFFTIRVAREDTNTQADPIHVSGCILLPGLPGAIFSDDVVSEAACTANSGKNASNSFRQYDAFAKFGNDGNYIQVRLPNYNSYGVDNVTVTLTGIR